MERKPYPSDVNGEEWALVASSLTLMKEDTSQRDYPLREVFQRFALDRARRSAILVDNEEAPAS